MSRHHVLLIVNSASEQIGTVRDHIDALEHGLDAHVLKADCSIAERADLSGFHAVILHYSLVISSRAYISRRLEKKLHDFDGLCILFVQDEYRWIDRTAAAIRDLSVDVVFSVVAPDTVRQVYHHPWCAGLRFEHTLTGFVSERLAALPVPDWQERPLDVAYRARKLSSWIGHHTLQKWQIAERFLDDAARFDLHVDISTREADRLYGQDWIDLISNAKAVLGTESGASVCDFTGEIQVAVERHLRRHPDATYEELRDLYFADTESRITISAISPRCFEAAALRSLMIMYPGAYSGILEAGRHYVVLEPDHANMEEVVATLRDSSRSAEIIANAYQDIALSDRWTHAALAAHVDRVIREEAGPVVHAQRAPDAAETARIEQLTARIERRDGAWFALAMRAGKVVVAINDFLDRRLPDSLRAIVRPPVQALYRLSKTFALRMFLRG